MVACILIWPVNMRGMEWRRVIAIRSLLLFVEMQLVAASIFFEGRLLMIAAQYCSLESVLVAFLCIHYMSHGMRKPTGEIWGQKLKFLYFVPNTSQLIVKSCCEILSSLLIFIHYFLCLIRGDFQSVGKTTMEWENPQVRVKNSKFCIWYQTSPNWL